MKGINQEQAVTILPDFCSKFIVLNLHYEKDFFGPAADLIATSFAFRSSVDPLPIGASIPNADKKMKDVAGMEVSFKDAMNTKGLLVMFSCNTCPVVHAYQSRTIEVCNYAKSKDIGVILLNSNEGSRDNGDSFSDMKDYAGEQHYNWPYVVDENSVMANAFGATRTPECFLFNARWQISLSRSYRRQSKRTWRGNP